MRRFVGSGVSWAVLSCAALLTLAPSARARVDFEIDYSDAPGEGFFDETPRAALADNSATTLGGQRRVAFEHAIEIWARALDSAVMVRIEATFAPIPELPCTADSGVLGAARAEAGFSGFSGAPRQDLFYPSPLADKLAGKDLDPTAPDLTALLNPRIDDNDCLGRVHWDYSLSPDGSEAGLVSTVLHELAHGLGFASLANELTGESDGGLSIFDAFMFDHVTGLTWDVMTNDERKASVSSPYNLAWLGPHVTDAAPTVLARGAPHVELDDGSVLDAVAEPSFEPFLGGDAISGDLVVLSSDEACSRRGSLQGQVVLLQDGTGCADLVQQLDAVARRGALAALTRSLLGGLPPWGIVSDVNRVSIPSLALTEEDFDALVDRLTSQSMIATLATNESLLGTDADGHVLLSATEPVQPGSSGSHWDASVRRVQRSPSDPVSLLMEPAAAGTLRNEVKDLTVQLLQDIGWDDLVCGNGIVEGDEQCDEGIDNSDEAPDACRMNCLLPSCGDGVVDSGEGCDAPEAGVCSDTCQSLDEQNQPEPRPAPDAGAAPPPSPIPVDAGPSKPAPKTPAKAVDSDGGSERATPPRVDIPKEGCACHVHRSRAPGGSLVLLFIGLLLVRVRGRAGRSPCGRS